MNKSKVYICGKVTGLEKSESVLRFQDAEMKLRNIGFDTVNPIRLIEIESLRRGFLPNWDECMKICIRELVQCDYIYIIPQDVATSNGAKLEMVIAYQLKIQCIKITNNE